MYFYLLIEYISNKMFSLSLFHRKEFFFDYVRQTLKKGGKNLKYVSGG